MNVESPEIKAEIDKSYFAFIDRIIFLRFCIIVPIGVTLYLSFGYLDSLFYPDKSLLFWNVRCVTTLICMVLVLMAMNQRFRRHTVIFLTLCIFLMACSVEFIINQTDGSSSHYYEGLNLQILAVGFTNSFYLRRNYVIFAMMLVCYEAAVIFSHASLNYTSFLFANYFMFSTVLFVILMTRFYSQQHYKAYVSEQKQALLYRKAEHLATTDALTGVNNRRSFLELLKDKIRDSEANKASFYIIMFDVDHFKTINDSYGHSFGDHVLIKIVEEVRRKIRTSDLFGRYGGDEFFICLDFKNQQTLGERLKKILEGVENLNLTCEGRPVKVTISMGAAQFQPNQAMSVENLLTLADAQLLAVKRDSRNNFKVVDAH